MRSRIITIVLAIGLGISCILLASRIGQLHLPGNQRDYAPVQPIAYSHRLHAGEMQIPCLYCHYAAQFSRHASVPPAGVCMNCHREVTASLGAVHAEDAAAEKEKRKPRQILSPELRKLYDALALDGSLQPDPNKKAQPIVWNRVHALPSFVYFDHRAHVRVGVACQQCHGPVEAMERVRQFSDLSMGWCVNCHRQANQTGVAGTRVNASTNCSTCHF
ncbi:MAG: cytochrome c3 family protein [Bryobacterales bacterium]|nr:cytochrome c3 family protein [Bryobacterales bacterium]